MPSKSRKFHPLLIIFAVIVIALLNAAWGAASPAGQAPTPTPAVDPARDLTIGSTTGITWLAGAIFLMIVIPILLRWKQIREAAIQTETPR